MRVLLIALLFSIPNFGFACSCGPKDFDHDFEYYEYIFEGMVKSIEVDSFQSIYHIEIEVAEKYKGDLSDSIKVQTLTTSAACGFDFEVEQRYFIVASEYEFFTLIREDPQKVDHPTVNSCGTTMKIVGNEEFYNGIKERLRYLNEKSS